MDAYEQCLEPACSCDSSIAACTGDDEDDDADEYCDNGGSDVSSDIAGTTNHGSGVGWCMSTLDEKVGCTASPAECWAACEGAHGDKLVAIDWYADGSCWCQDDCPCMDFDLSPVVITRADVTLPTACTICACSDVCLIALSQCGRRSFSRRLAVRRALRAAAQGDH